jgi:prephenate dehydratase
MSIKVTIQGQEGSFHHQAARQYFGEGVQTVGCASFAELYKKAEDPQIADAGLMAIENSIAGSIMNNYKLMQRGQLFITGEIFLGIRQHLMVNPGIKMRDIREVHSHPVALLQCSDFLEQHPQWKLIESQDTAFSARYIYQHKARHMAAIASELAAKLFKLEILARDVQSVENNFTRFLVLSRSDFQFPEDATKASVYFQAEHRKGSLANILMEMASAGINLSKLQSVPIPGTAWEYGFHADLEFNQIDQFNNIMDALQHLTTSLRVFGVYKKGQTT